MDAAMDIHMTTAMAMAMRLIRMVTVNLTVSPWKISVTSAEVAYVKGNQVMLVMRMAICNSTARELQHMKTITIVAAMTLAAVRLEQSNMVECGSIRIVTSLVTVSK